MENLRLHPDYQESLIERGVLLAFGPHWTDDEQPWNGERMVEDLMHACGARRVRVRPWLINLGSLLVELDYTKVRSS